MLNKPAIKNADGYDVFPFAGTLLTMARAAEADALAHRAMAALARRVAGLTARRVAGLTGRVEDIEVDAALLEGTGVAATVRAQRLRKMAERLTGITTWPSTTAS